MLPAKALKFINLSIAVLLVLGLAVVYWFAYRTLPKTSGQIAAPISARATVVRDAIGVPHISAARWEDAIFLQGYVTAQDRLWQMDALRRLASGQLSEVLGPSTLALDEEARRLRLWRAADQDERSLAGTDRAVLAAYARGVNYFIETHRGALPLEFTLLRYDPRPWTIADSILCGLQMYRSLTSTWRDELRKAAMLSSGDPAKVSLLFPLRAGAEIQPGSNAWVISGKWTASGKPILANDPHLDWTIPAPWYQVHLKAPGLNVSGVSLPGLPCVIVGHNARIAWGVTNLGFNVQDLYIEKINPQTGRYVFGGQVEQARAETEWIRVKNARPVEFRQWVTRHGPVAFFENGKYLALRWTATDEDGFVFPFLDLDRASNWTEFTAALARYPGPSQNFVYADVDGNIGYHAAGRLPIRKNFDGDVPVDGSSGDFEWAGDIPFDQLPAFYNPPRGWIVTANQDPFPQNYPYRVSGAFGAPFRAAEIRDRITSRTGWKPQDMLAVQKDVYSSFAHHLARQIVNAYDHVTPRKPELAEAVSLLRSWNGQMERRLSAPLLVTLTYDQLRRMAVKTVWSGPADVYQIMLAPAAIENIVDSNSSLFFHNTDQALLNALASAIEEGRTTQGSNLARWDWGAYNLLTIKHPVGSQLPLVGKYFNIGPVEMSGSGTSIKQVSPVLGPSMRFVADLANWDGSWNNIDIGQSGQILSRHYHDQWSAYYVGHSFPMQFDKVDTKQTLTVNPQ
ncbi:MAG TPA: penicillin acylase family protein [Bryobacteraceae bacterium]|nr:penicillin acylase family protein [Bryobacteraceae bacterium]